MSNSAQQPFIFAVTPPVGNSNQFGNQASSPTAPIIIHPPTSSAFETQQANDSVEFPGIDTEMYPEDHMINGLNVQTEELSRQENGINQQLMRDIINGAFNNHKQVPMRQLSSPSSCEDDLLLSTSPFCITTKRKRGAAKGYSPRISPPIQQEWDVLPVSRHAKNTINPIRRIVDVMSVQPNPEKSLIKLHLGDPTLTGTLLPSDRVLMALQKALHSHNFNGYGPAIGLLEARESVARHVTSCGAPTTADDVILTSGCSQALQLAIEAFANPGDNILVPKPGFPLYTTLMRPHDIEDRFYELDMENGALVNLEDLEAQIDDRTRAIVINNPSNPTGAVYPKEHLEQILQIAHRHKVPIIADEIYSDMTYDGAVFHPISTLEPKVPVVSCDGISKRFLVPGWRLGWVTVHDPYGALKNVRDGMRNLAQKIVGPCALVQGALPAILETTPPEFFENVKRILANNANIAYAAIDGTCGLRPVKPQGAMYMMVGVDAKDFPAFGGDEMAFVKALIAEESVYCLPGTAFHCPGWIRLVLTYPSEITQDACQRIVAFAQRHYRKVGNKLSLPDSAITNGDTATPPTTDDDTVSWCSEESDRKSSS